MTEAQLNTIKGLLHYLNTGAADPASLDFSVYIRSADDMTATFGGIARDATDGHYEYFPYNET